MDNAFRTQNYFICLRHSGSRLPSAHASLSCFVTWMEYVQGRWVDVAALVCVVLPCLERGGGKERKKRREKKNYTRRLDWNEEGTRWRGGGAM